MTIPVHRDTDSRACGATTVVEGNSTVYANLLLVSVSGDPNSHGYGNLGATSKEVYCHNILVVHHAPDPAVPDGLCLPLGGAHCAPDTAQGSPDVFTGGPGDGDLVLYT
jgi:hypothetical protein